MIASAHRKVGIAIARKWDLPETVAKCVQSCDDYDAANRMSAVNAVRFANALAKREGIYLGDVDGADNDALIMIGCSLLGLDTSVIDRLVKDLHARVGRHLT